MKILWFTNTPSLYDQGRHQYYGGGWIESLERHISGHNGIQLAISFFHPSDDTKVILKNTTYYPIKRKSGRKSPFKKLLNNWRGNLGDDGFFCMIKKVVDDFKPDVIQVFGTEGPFGRIHELTDVPVVIHLQGLINPCLNTYFPVSNSILDFLLGRKFFIKNLLGAGPAFGVKRFSNQAKRERAILGHARYVMGRTYWDRMISSLYNPSVNYFHVDEVLRPVFYKKRPSTQVLLNNQLSIVSTLSPTVYKGLDVVLRVAKQLKFFSRIDYLWNIAGIADDDPLLRHYEKKEGIFHRDVGIRCLGRKNPDKLFELLCRADVFVHPSYIDNSPNSVCEAQILGLPVIACDVGGLASLIQQDETGLLVPANGVFEIVHWLHVLAEDNQLARRLGQHATATARVRHDPDRIVDALEAAYRAISEEAR